MAEDAIKRVAKNLFSLLSVRAFDVIYTFSVMIILARYFGPELYGDYAFVTALVFIYLPIINFGITPIMVRELSVHVERREEIFGAGLAFRLLLTLAAVLGTVIVLPLTNLDSRLAIALVIGLLSELCLLGVRMCAEIFITFERMELETYLSLTNRILTLLLLLGIAYLDLGFLPVFITFATLNSLALIAAILVVKKNFFRPRLVWRSSLLWFWIKEALPLAISFGLLETFLRIDIMILRLFRDPSEIAYFDIAYKVIYRIVMVASVTAIVLSPAMARLAHLEMERFRELVEQVLKILLIIAIPVTLIAHILGPLLIVPCFGEKFIPAELAIATLAWCLFFSFFEPFLTGILISIKRVWLIPITNGIVLGVNLVLDLLLIPSYGYIGACYANIGAYALWFIVSLLISRHLLGFSLSGMFGRILPAGLIMTLAPLLWHYFYTNARVDGISRIMHYTLELVIPLLLYGVLLYFFKAVRWQEIVNLRHSLGKPHP